MAAQGASAAGMVLFVVFLDPEWLHQTPDTNQWLDVWDGYWTQHAVDRRWLTDDTKAYLEDAARNDDPIVSTIVRIPYLFVTFFCLRDLWSSLTQTGPGIRTRSRVGMMYDKYLGPCGAYFQHRMLMQQVRIVTIVGHFIASTSSPLLVLIGSFL